MVRKFKRGTITRVGAEFANLNKELSYSASEFLNKRVSHTKMSDYIGKVMKEEGIDQVILRRIRARRGLK